MAQLGGQALHVGQQLGQASQVTFQAAEGLAPFGTKSFRPRVWGVGSALGHRDKGSLQETEVVREPLAVD